MSCLGGDSVGIAESTGLPQPALDILVNDRKNIQRKGSVTCKKQEFINLWTSLLSLAILAFRGMKTLCQILTAMATYNFMDVPHLPCHV
jgi:hypothetical protein